MRLGILFTESQSLIELLYTTDEQDLPWRNDSRGCSRVVQLQGPKLIGRIETARHRRWRMLGHHAS